MIMRNIGSGMGRQKTFILCGICLVAVAMMLPAAAVGEETNPPAPPGANFTTNVSGGPAPLPVQCTDLSSGNPARWNWSFGDGTFSDEQNPIHTFLDPGTYTVRLMVSDGNGVGDTLTRPDSIEVTPQETEKPTQVPSSPELATPSQAVTEEVPAPVIDHLDPASAPSGGAGCTFHVLGTGFTENSKVQWDGKEKPTTFLSGTELSADIPSSDLLVPSGTRVSVRIFDYGGGGMSEQVDFLITEGAPGTPATGTPAEPPAADFTWAPSAGTAPLSVGFTDLSTGKPDAWNWSFGDGNYSSEENPDHTYVSEGLYSVVLAIGNSGGISSVMKADAINVNPPAGGPEGGTSLRNGGFETGDLGSWTAQYGENPDAPGSYSLITVDPGSRRSGTYGANISLHTGTEYSPFVHASLMQEIGELRAGDNISFWVKVHEGERDIGQLRPELLIRLESDDGQTFDIASIGRPQDWTFYRLKCPPGIRYGSLHWSIRISVHMGEEGLQDEEGDFLVFVDDFGVDLSSPPMPAPGPAPEPGPAPACTGRHDLIVDGGFESQAKGDTAVPSFPMSPLWHTDQSGAGGASVQTGLGMGPSYGAVLSLDDASSGNWISMDQTVVTNGARYCSLGFRYYSWMTGGRTSDLSVLLDGTEVWHVRDAGEWAIKDVVIDLSSFEGTHTLKFVQTAATGGQGEHADWFLDDIQLMANPALPSPAGYCFAREWGTRGSGNGQFFYPYGIATDPSGNVFVGDTNNYRIEKFDPVGKFLAAWATPDFPEDLAADGVGNVYMVDEWNSHVLTYDNEGNLLATWGSFGWEDGQLYYPTGIAVDAEGNSYIVPYSSVSRIQKFDPEGNFLAGFGNDGSGNGQYDRVGGIAVDESGKVYVADTGNSRIMKYDTRGNLLATWGTWGLGYGEFDGLTGIAVDAAGNVFVLDQGNSRVQEFDPSGKFLTTWGTPGSGTGEFANPEGIAAGRLGNIYVVDTENHRIQQFGPCGQTEPIPEPDFPVGGGSLTRIARGPDPKENPAIDRDRVVWTGQNDIHLFDLPTGEERRVTTDSSAQDYARISGDRIVYMDGRRGYWHVFLHDLSTGAEQPIGTGTVSETYPDISGDRIVWMDGRNHKNELWLYDLSTGTERQIATGAVNPGQPSISGSRVAYRDVRDGNTDIYLYDLTTGGETRITTDPGYSVYPDISGDTIVWADSRNGAMDVYSYDIPTRTESRLSSTEGSEQFPRVSGNLVTWRWTSPAGIDAIVLYDVKNRTPFQVTPNEGSKGNPDLSGNRVAFPYTWGGNTSIMVFTWDGNPVRYLVADLHARYTSIPALEPLVFNDTSYGVAPTRWRWDFGDGTTSALRNPVHTYEDPGLYSVGLTVSAGTGFTDTMTKSDYIHVTAPLTEVPVPDFSATVTYGEEPLQVTFSDLSNGFPSEWLWDFGDGATSMDESPVHVYTSAGLYTVSLTASNHVGPNTTLKTDYIAVFTTTPPPPPPPPFPTITDISPLSMAEGSPGFTLHVTGTNFTEKSKVFWNYVDRNTRLISSTRLEADIPASDVAHASSKPMDVSIFTYDGGGQSNRMEFWVTSSPSNLPTPTPTPVPQPGALVLTVTPKQHRVQPYQLLRYDIWVYQDGHPVPADIEVKLDGKSIASFRSSGYYLYEFYPPSVDEHSIEITAKDGNRRASPDPWGEKILTYGSITPALLRVDMMHTAADNEMYSAEEITAYRNIEFWYTAMKDSYEAVTARILEIMFSPQLGKASEKFFSTDFNPGTWIEAKIDLMMGHHQLLADGIAQTLFSISDIHEYLASAEGSHRIYTEISENRDVLVQGFYDDVDSDNSAFKDHIQYNAPSYANSEPLMDLFNLYGLALQNVVEYWPVSIEFYHNGPEVETRQMIPILSWNQMPMKEMADRYDLADRYKDEFTVTRLSLFTAQQIAYNAGFENDSLIGGFIDLERAFVDAEIGILDIINPLVVLIEDTISGAGDFKVATFTVIKGLWLVDLNVDDGSVAWRVDTLHGNGIEALKEGAEKGIYPYGSLSLKAEDSLVLVPTVISSTGDALVISSDGRVIDIIRGTGFFNPPSAGTYRVVAYQHAGALFSDVASASFEVASPEITLAETHTVQGSSATIASSVCNEEALTMDNLSLVLEVTKGDGTLVFSRATGFSLEGGECRDDTFSFDLPESGVYIGRMELARHLFTMVTEKTFILRAGEPIPDGVAMVGTEIQDSYSPFDQVVLNVTLEGYRPITTFTLKMPDFGYAEEVTVHGVQTAQIRLPPLQPDTYVTPIVAERDGAVLDSRIVRITVRAEGVGIVTLMPDAVFYPMPGPVGVNLTLRDLLTNSLDGEARITVIDPEGQVSAFSSPAGNGRVQFQFNPSAEGTYVIKGTASKPGWIISGDRTLVIVGNMSPILMGVQKEGVTYTVRTYANGLPAPCSLTVTGGGVAEKVFAGAGIAVINRTGSFSLAADKMFYSPAHYSYTAPETLPTANFEVNKTGGTAPLAVRFDDMSDGRDLFSWTWAFGDATYASEQSPDHVYEEPGIYSVTLTVSNSSGSNFLTRTDYITVGAPVPPVAGFAADKQSGKVPLTVSFTDTSPGEPRAWIWTFGDGESSDEQHPVHGYSMPGTYDVTLTVTNKAGSDARTETGFITVLPRMPPVADFAGSPESGTAPLTVSFTDLSTNAPESWQWTFGDGAGSTARNPSHAYTTPGLYTVTLKAANPDGTDTKAREEYIAVAAPPVPPVARFSVTPVMGRVPLTATFTDRSTGSPTSWEWTFGDGGTSALQAPVHTYNGAGMYIARLKVSNGAGTDTAWRLVVVLPRWWWWG